MASRTGNRALMEPSPQREWIYEHALVLGTAVLALIIIALLIRPPSLSASILEQEDDLFSILQDVHNKQAGQVRTSDGRFSWLPELMKSSAEDSAILQLEPADGGGSRADLYRVDDYYVAVYLTDWEREDNRAWSSSLAMSDNVGQLGYGAFAWPVNCSEGSQWSFFIDHRGKLLGSMNHQSQLNGTDPPFPPNAHPLRDYMNSRKSGEASPWVLFAAFEEILPSGDQ